MLRKYFIISFVVILFLCACNKETGVGLTIEKQTNNNESEMLENKTLKGKDKIKQFKNTINKSTLSKDVKFKKNNADKYIIKEMDWDKSASHLIVELVNEPELIIVKNEKYDKVYILDKNNSDKIRKMFSIE